MNPHQAPRADPWAMLENTWHNRRLIFQMAKREVIGRYRGSVMGLAWSFFNPLIMLVIYTFVFSVVFKARWGKDAGGGKANFAIILFVGMIVHGLFAECVNRAPSIILSNVNYVKKVVFPLEILPWVAMGSAFFHSLISLGVLLLVQLLVNHTLPWTAVFIPLVLIPLVLVSMGVTWFLTALGVYLRDIAQITVVFTTVLLFLSPVFYPLSSLPESYQKWLQLNPLTFMIETSREVLVFGHPPNWSALGAALLVGFLVAAGGFYWFQKTRGGFADVL